MFSIFFLAEETKKKKVLSAFCRPDLTLCAVLISQEKAHPLTLEWNSGFIYYAECFAVTCKLSY